MNGVDDTRTPTPAEVRAQLTGPGGMFEMVPEEIRSITYQVYSNRRSSLRDILATFPTRGDAVCLRYGEQAWTYTDFFETMNGLSRSFAEQLGLAHGDRVAVLSQNNPEWCLTFWATVGMGGVLVGLNGWWKADEIIYGIQDSGAKVLVADPKRFERIADRLGECPDLETVILTSPDVPAVAGRAASGCRIMTFADVAGTPSTEVNTTPIDEDDLAIIFYSSGTTGRPKGVMSTHRGLIAGVQNTEVSTIANGMIRGPRTNQAAMPQLVSLFTSPLFHVSGCLSTLVIGTAVGSQLVMPVGRADPAEILRSIDEYRVSLWATVPTLLWRVCGHEDRGNYDLSSVVSLAFGGSPSAGELQRRIASTFPNVRSTSNGYGLTESSAIATSISGADLAARPASVGQAMPGVELRIVDDDGTALPSGEHGEIWIKAAMNMVGYWNKPEATADAMRDGWLLTGDIGYLDEDGFLYITDRKKDMIIRGGENIYSSEVEERLISHGEIGDAGVVGVPHPELGEEVKAIVHLTPGSKLTEVDVRAWVADGLASFKVPAHVEFTDEPLPRNASGKLLKNLLRGERGTVFEELM